MDKQATMNAIEELAHGHYPSVGKESHGWNHIQDVLRPSAIIWPCQLDRFLQGNKQA